MLAPDLAILVSENCHLCEIAMRELDRVTARTGVPWRSVALTEGTEEYEQYHDRAPVVFLNGVEHSFWRVETERLVANLLTLCDDEEQ